jgi:hypothetical protein
MSTIPPPPGGGVAFHIDSKDGMIMVAFVLSKQIFTLSPVSFGAQA